MHDKSRRTADKSGAVICLGLTPAVQRTLSFARFQPGEVNRACRVEVSVGGKAVNTGLALVRLRRACVVTGLNGGGTGRDIAAHLAAHGVACAFTRTPWPTRICTTILDRASGVATELVEEARAPTPVLLSRFEARGRALLRAAGAAVICGTLPSGVPEDFWSRLSAEARRLGVPLVIDSHGPPLLRALPCEPLLAKMNVRELEQTFASACRGRAQIVAAARRLVAAGAQWALITHGAAPAMLVSRAGGVWQVSPPAIGNVASPIGSGDCVNAGVMHALLLGKAMPDAVRFGLGCGSANALTPNPAEFSPGAARRLAKACRVLAACRT
jgi:1-phosphofructokinase family hexose kinase